MAAKRKYTDDELRRAVESSTTFRMVAQKLGAPTHGGGYELMRKRIDALDLPTSHLKRHTTWSDAKLQEAVAVSTNFKMVARNLGVNPFGGSYKTVCEQVRKLGIDTSHFDIRRGRYTRRKRWNDDQLRAAVAESRSVRGAIAKLGLIAAGGNYNQIRQRIKELELDTSHMTGQAWNAGLKFDPRPHAPLEEVLVANRPSTSHRLKLRLFRAGLKTPACELCGWAARAPDGRIPVELDHINGDRTDNRLENLRILCPNCHSLQSTHRGLNQKRAIARRESRKIE